MCHIQTMTIPVVSTVTRKPRFVRVTGLSATGLIFLCQSNDSGEWPSFYKPPAQSHLLSNYHVDLVSPLINLFSTLRRSPGHSRVGEGLGFRSIKFCIRAWHNTGRQKCSSQEWVSEAQNDTPGWTRRGMGEVQDSSDPPLPAQLHACVT